MARGDRDLVVTIGEAMAVLIPAAAGTFASAVGGAEFNVAASLGRMGVATSWVSRLGADGLGERILREASECSVGTDAVERDPLRATGLYIKEIGLDDGVPRSTMRYYRAGSAASAIDAAYLGTPAVAAQLRRARVVHVSGVTPALSAATAEAMTGLRERLGDTATLSVDLNLRPALWAGRDRSALDALVAQADLLFTGADEARAHFGHDDPARLLADHPRLGTVVLKDDSRHASSHRRDGVVVVPALRVSVREPVGAGDAFAAGYLAAMLEERDETVRLRTAHALAALALVSDGDRPESVPGPDERERIARTREWDSWRVAAGSTPWAAER